MQFSRPLSLVSCSEKVKKLSSGIIVEAVGFGELKQLTLQIWHGLFL